MFVSFCAGDATRPTLCISIEHNMFSFTIQLLLKLLLNNYLIK